MPLRCWNYVLVGATLALHVLLITALPKMDGNLPRSCPVMVHLEALTTEPKPVPPPIAPADPVQPLRPPVMESRVQPMKAAPVIVRTATPPVPAKPAPVVLTPGAVGATGSPSPAPQPENPGRLAGSGSNGPVAPSGSGGPTPSGLPPAGPGPGTGTGPNDAMPAPGIDTGKLLTEYSSGVSSRIRQHQQYPRSEQQAGHEGKVKVSFTLSADGRLLDVSVASSSGFSELDAAAEAAVKAAAPFAPIPTELKRSSAKLSITLRFFLQ